MVDKIRKRDGGIVVFEKEKITNAIYKAAVACGGEDRELAAQLADKVVDILDIKFADRVPEVEQVQDVVEYVLIENCHAKTAKAYILYREKRQSARYANALTGATIDMFSDYLNDKDWHVQENANMQKSVNGLNNYVREVFTKKYWLNQVYPVEVREAHESGLIHIHDLGMLSGYCAGWDLKQLIQDGFGGVERKVESAPPKHLSSLLGQIVNSTFTTQGELAGAQAWANFDTYCAPFIRYDELTYEEVKQQVQEFVYNLNVPTRVGFQAPFSNITFDLTCPNNLKEENVVYTDRVMVDRYGEFQHEMDMLNRAFCEVMLEGDAKGRVFTFPVPTINITPEFDWSTESVAWFMKVTAKYGIPYFANYVNSDMSAEDAVSMCPLDGDTFVFCRNAYGHASVSTIKDIVNRMNKEGRSGGVSEYDVWSGSEWVKAFPVKVPATDILEVSFSNGESVSMGVNHLQPVMGGDCLKAEDLEVGMWLPFNKNAVEFDRGDWLSGFAVGAYAGDGSHDKNRVIYSICAAEKSDETERLLRDFWEQRLGFSVYKYTNDKVRFLSVSAGAYSYIERFVQGGDALNKRFTHELFGASKEFKEGVLEGLRQTDGARGCNRLYTSSEQLRDDICVLLSSMGRKYVKNYEDSRPGRLGVSTNYRIDYPNRDNYGELYKTDDEFFYYKITNINRVSGSSRQLYCFEVKDDSHLFMLANGLITHNCRLRISTDELKHRGGGLFGSNPLTGSIGVVTINLPRIAYQNKNEKLSVLFDSIRDAMRVASTSLIVKRKMVEQYTDQGMYPFSAHYLRNIKQRTGEYWYNHFSTIGLVGMNEALLNYAGVELTSPVGQQLAVDILEFMRDTLKEFQEDTGHVYNLEASPAEGTSYRLAKLDKERYPDIITASCDVPYYTNSSHLPVGYTDDIFETLDKQDRLQSCYTGGTVLHLYLGEAIDDPDICAKLIQRIFQKYRLPYISITPTFSICPAHGYIPRETSICPQCGAETEIWSRVTGYLRPVKDYNVGKKEEYQKRLKYTLRSVA